MINYIYQLVSPQVFSIKYEDMDFKGKVIVKPLYMSICHADQRYYLGKRDKEILNKKLPMALIHECCGEVVYDDNGNFNVGDKVVIIPNVPSMASSIIFENYRKGSYFLSSGHDGFMREFISISADRLVKFDNIDLRIAAMTEFFSVGVHACERFNFFAHGIKETIGIWGDGSLAYIMANILKVKYPNSKIVVIGKNERKLSLFSFVDKTYLSESLPSSFEVDHAFECVGGEGSYYAIDNIVKYINPQGAVMLMGVTENKVPINTRDVLEKGLTLVGSSRSGRTDFEKAIEYMKDKRIQGRLNVIVYEDKPVCNIDDIHRVFGYDLNTPFKTVFKWDL